jgi:hypothetical protein
LRNLLALIDSRVADALDRDQRERCEATADVVRSVLAEFIVEFKHVRGEIDSKLAQLQMLLAERSSLDPQARPERPN